MAITTNAELAKLVVTELKREGMNLAADEVTAAEYYVEQGFATLVSLSDYDPATEAAEMAREAVVLFAKNRFKGVPGASKEFMDMANRWTKQAAIDYHYTNDVGLFIDPTDQAYYG